MKTVRLGMLLCLLWTPAALATPALARLYQQEYGYVPSCAACHTAGGGSALNAYGKDFKAAGKHRAALVAIAGKDSDGDGVANAVEARARANPGDRRSTPAQPGDWLDINSLVPREIRQHFAGTRDWVTRDALLTPADLAAAKAQGVLLSAADENTIYVPLENQRPAGTALIFEVRHQGKPFYLMMTTDRQLVVTSVSVLNADQVPAARQRDLYRTFAGKPVQALPKPVGRGLEADIAAAVQRAGMLLHVRLRGS